MLCLPIHGAPRNVRYGSKADISRHATYVRLVPIADALSMSAKCQQRT